MSFESESLVLDLNVIDFELNVKKKVSRRQVIP